MYKYETHLHTKECSLCATASGAYQAEAYKDAGYTGIIITDHFFRGNTNVRRDLPWEERIDLFCKGYENAKAAYEALKGKGIDLLMLHREINVDLTDAKKDADYRPGSFCFAYGSPKNDSASLLIFRKIIADIS